MKISKFSLVVLFVTACNGSSGSTDAAVDLTMPGDLTVFSCCGKPGDTGNEKGVGKYCKVAGDCGGGASVCSAIQNTPDRSTFFCTTVCTPQNDGGTSSDCGSNALCVKDSKLGLYGCVPTTCVTNPPAGCMN